jgi:hypothetical protein
MQQDFFESMAVKRTKEIQANGSVFRYSKINNALYFEFLLRKGTELPADIGEESDKLLKIIENFRKWDFKVKLGSILEAEFQEYYVTQRFSFLKERLSSALSKT